MTMNRHVAEGADDDSAGCGHRALVHSYLLERYAGTWSALSDIARMEVTCAVRTNSTGIRGNQDLTGQAMRVTLEVLGTWNRSAGEKEAATSL